LLALEKRSLFLPEKASISVNKLSTIFNEIPLKVLQEKSPAYLWWPMNQVYSLFPPIAYLSIHGVLADLIG
jgi:hypothetical protein